MGVFEGPHSPPDTFLTPFLTQFWQGTRNDGMGRTGKNREKVENRKQGTRGEKVGQGTRAKGKTGKKGGYKESKDKGGIGATGNREKGKKGKGEKRKGGEKT